MAHPSPIGQDELDETGYILAELRRLKQATSSPVVRACLEEAHDDIAHLQSADDSQEEGRLSNSA